MCCVETGNNGKQLTNAALAIAYSQSSLTLPFIRLNAPFDYRSVSSSVNWIPYITITISMYAHVCNIIISEFRVLSVYIPQLCRTISSIQSANDSNGMKNSGVMVYA